MKANRLKIISVKTLFILVGLCIFFWAHLSYAADLSFNDDTVITIGTENYTILSGSGATSMTVGTLTLTVTTPANSSFTLVSHDKYILDDDSSTISATCSKADNRIVVDSATTIVITPDTSTECSTGASGSSGGSSYTREIIPDPDPDPIVTPVVTLGNLVSLKPGTNGSVTTAWQQALTDAGFNPGPIDGLWGLKTAAAVRAFQTSQGLVADGWPGLQTAAMMNGLEVLDTLVLIEDEKIESIGLLSPLKPGTNGSVTTAWQQALTDAGFNPGPIDGLWGLKTAAAVRAFQTSQGLVADGWPGLQTATMMNYLE